MFSNPDKAMRAAWASAAVETFRAVCRGSPLDDRDGMQEAIGDLLADILHLARQEGLDPEAMINTGRMHFEAEESEEAMMEESDD